MRWRGGLRGGVEGVRTVWRRTHHYCQISVVVKVVLCGFIHTFHTCRATFEDKILSSDIVFLRAWVAVDVPHFFNPVTNLLSKQIHPRAPVGIDKRGRTRRTPYPPPSDVSVATAAAAAAAAVVPAPAAAAAAAPASRGPDLTKLLALPLGASASRAPVAAAAAGLMEFQPSPRFTGGRPGFIFRLGPQGQGYYRDHGTKAAVERAAAASAAVVEAAATQASAAAAVLAGGGGGALSAAGWQPMRTVAQLRRDGGIGAPRNTDSLYRPIERAPRKFNPLKIPLSLQVGGVRFGAAVSDVTSGSPILLSHSRLDGC